MIFFNIYQYKITMMIKVSLAALLILIFSFFLADCTLQTTSSTLWPMPALFQRQDEGPKISITPCQIKYVVQSPARQMIQDIIALYQSQVFKCQPQTSLTVLNIIVRSSQVLIPTETKHEAYQITLRTNMKWQLIADYYPGFLRGFETFSQLFEENSSEMLQIKDLPINIEDEPEFKWRGLMIDTARHYLPVSEIKKIIDGLMYSKMNVLHWHIVDQDSFPMQIPIRPELSQFGKVSEVYSTADLQNLVLYAAARGIRLIPQIDTPAHTESWGRSQKYKEIVLKCDGIYKGQLDPTLPLTMSVISDILKYVNSIFSDKYIHLGGDEVDELCWDQRPTITDYMKSHNIANYSQLSADFRKREKEIMRGINSQKKPIFWANDGSDLPLEEGDTVQWWGLSDDFLHSLLNKSAGEKDIILSYYDQAYLDIGFGSREGDDYAEYENWRTMYNFKPKKEGFNVIGGEACLWSQISNQYTHQQKIFLRTNVIAQRLWNSNINIEQQLNNVATRLFAQATRLKKRGFKISPVTVALCEELDMSICFFNSTQ